MNQKSHWEHVYETKNPQEVSWTQEKPVHSLDLIKELNLPKNAKIIDIGGGDSNLVDYLLELEFTDISVLDISQKAIEKAKLRLGEKAKQVTWIVSDILGFKPEFEYDLWHDRAAFHFLTKENDINHYKNLVENHANSHFILATFSENGPLKCSGLEISQYSKEKLQILFSPIFFLNSSFTIDHKTPFQTKQNFIFANFSKLK
ncbi:MAG: class I SAM-dependent methyltransferase [Bacteroidota bacterium]